METAKNRNLTFVAILLGMVASVLMQTIIAIALPIITNELGRQELYGWIFSSYMIASIITIPLFANLSDIYGRKPFYLWGMILFLIGSLLSGFSQSMNQLMIFRVLQGIGAGAIAPSAIAIISELFKEDKRVKMLGIFAAFQVLASIIGPILGGMITDFYSWRWTFFMNIPIGIIALLLLYRNYSDLPEDHRKARKRVDYIGSLALGFFLVLTIIFFQRQELVTFILAVVFLIIFIFQEKKHVNPIIPLHFIKLKNVKASFLSMFLLGTISYGMITILPLYGQTFLGAYALSGGKILVFFSLGVGIGGIVSGTLSKRITYFKLIIGSWLITLLGLFLLIVTKTSSINWLYTFVLIVGGGLGISLPLLIALSQNSVEKNKQAVIGGLIQISRNVGGAVGVPLFTTVVLFEHDTFLALNNFELMFLIMAFLASIGLFIGFRFRENQL